MRHCRVDVVPSPVIRTPHKPDPIVAKKNDVTVPVATKYHPFVVGTMPTLHLGDFGFAQRASIAASRQSTMFHQCGTARLGDRQSLSRPCPFGDARVIAFHDVPGTSELVQLAVLTPAGGNGEHQKCSAVSFDAFQHRENGRSELQITHKEMASNGRRIRSKYLLPIY